MVQWSHFEEKQARRFIRNEIDLYGKNMEADECEGAAWQAYFEVREKYIHDLGNADYWICAARKIKCALENLRKIRNEKIKNHSNLSLYATIGENQEELISIIASKHGDFSNSAVF